jgi:hypothetical protein
MQAVEVVEFAILIQVEAGGPGGGGSASWSAAGNAGTANTGGGAGGPTCNIQGVMVQLVQQAVAELL